MTEDRLIAAWRKLSGSWELTKTEWNDNVRNSFERKYWSIIEKQTMDTIKAMQALSEALASANG